MMRPDEESDWLSDLDWLADYPPPRSLPLDQEALRVYEHAYAIGREVEEPGTPPISYTTVISALLTAKDDTSRWFSSLAAELGPDPELVFAEKGVTRAEVEKLTPTKDGGPAEVQLSTDRQLLTVSARAVISNAEAWVQRVGGSDIGVRHLVASYVVNPPPAHRAQMERWEFQETRWHEVFFDWVAARYTAEQWTDASRRPALTQPLLGFEEQEIKGAALAYPADEQTTIVLQRSAEIHAAQPDHWLRLQTVLRALIDCALEDGGIGLEIGPIVQVVEEGREAYDRAIDAQFDDGGPVQDVSFDALDISPRVLNALETARGLAVATWDGEGTRPEVGVHHLAGALLSRRVDGAEEIMALGIEGPSLRRDLIAYAAERHRDRIELWREALGEEEHRSVGRPIELNSDEPEAVVRLDEEWTSDPLGIRRDVETFAALLASEKLEPPLSIGLFGPWGSGKTTFLRRLRRAVDQRADEARKASEEDEPTPYVSHVVHVDFNAWHFAESALTSSLVETIFRALEGYISENVPMVGQEWEEQKRKALETTRRKVEAAQAVERAAKAAVERAESDLADTREVVAKESNGLRSVLQTVWGDTKKTLEGDEVVAESGVLQALGDAIDGGEELRRRLDTLRSRPGRLLGDLGWARSLGFAALVLALPPLVAWIVGGLLEAEGTVQALAMATTALSTVGVWARSAAGAAAKLDSAVVRVADAYAKRVEKDPTVLEGVAAVASAKAKAETAAASLHGAREQLAQARAELANATVPAQMLQLVSERVGSEAYSRELTTLSLARADLEALSLLLREGRTTADSATSPPDAEAKRTVDRVILYIDDLDRCKPEDVVRVLQVVHMLLAFELFVVVVAVDARWVEESLRQSFEWLGPGAAEEAAGQGSSRGARTWITPQDYLEKIFQIAFWLEPMTVSRAAAFLGSLVRAPQRVDGGPVYRGGTAESDSVAIAGIEIDYMRALAAYVGSSPRRVKRLVNAYRLIKAGLSDAQLETFLTDRRADGENLRSGPYQLVIGLLVIGTGAPSTSSRIIRELSECDPRTQAGDLVEDFRAREEPGWGMAAQVLETLIRTQRMTDVSELRGWARKVARFLLNRPARDLHQRQREREDEADRRPANAADAVVGAAEHGAQDRDSNSGRSRMTRDELCDIVCECVAEAGVTPPGWPEGCEDTPLEGIEIEPLMQCISARVQAAGCRIFPGPNDFPSDGTVGDACDMLSLKLDCN